MHITRTNGHSKRDALLEQAQSIIDSPPKTQKRDKKLSLFEAPAIDDLPLPPIKKGRGFKKPEAQIQIPTIKITRVEVPIIGLTPYIAHNWSEKAKRMMLEKQMGTARTAREKRNPKADFEAAKYLDKRGRDCIPARSFKSAIVDAASIIDGITKVQIRLAVWVDGDLLPLMYERCEMVEDMVRNQTGVADLRYRPYYFGWKVKLPIKLNERVITIPQLVNLINHAGFVGVGDWRPEKNGEFGRFSVGDMK